jgi:hypothetical protein
MKISEPIMQKIKGCWRKLHIEELNDLYSSRRMGRTCSMHGGKEICKQSLGGKT